MSAGKQAVVLIGMPGVGKSTIGAGLAQALGYSFVDLDDCIRAREGCTLQAIIDSRGENYLLQLERQCMNELDMQRKVIAPGGSIVYNRELMERLRAVAVLVYLEDALENVASRLKDAPTRGIVGLKSRSLQELYEERRPLYARYADLTVNSSGKAVARVVEEIVRGYRLLQETTRHATTPESKDPAS